MTFLSIEAILIFWKHAAFTAIRNNQPYRYFLFAANRLKMQKFKPRIDLKSCGKIFRQKSQKCRYAPYEKGATTTALALCTPIFEFH